MQQASDAMDFEMAAVYRDRLKALTFIQGNQAVNATGLPDADIFALASKGSTVCIQAFFIRGGQNWGHRSFFPAHTSNVEIEDVFSSFLMQFYNRMPPPKLVLLDRELPDEELLAEALSTKAEYKVSVSKPQRGDRRKLLEQASRNANEALERRLAESSTQAKIMREMVELLELDAVPDRIEIYDNSHTQGTNMVGGMVVAGPEGFPQKRLSQVQYQKPRYRTG